jgi:pimeloyl-ACP methyl ester carboxylesterase
MLFFRANCYRVIAADRRGHGRSTQTPDGHDLDHYADDLAVLVENWWCQGMMSDALSHYDGIVAFSQTDFTEDLKKITIPTLVMHSTDDQIVPYVAAGPSPPHS